MRNLLLTIFLLMQAAFLQAQNFPKNYFIPPVGYRMVLSGNFAETRPNHFHSGIDIKTHEEIGKKMYAIADGYVSRINFSPYGYGLALYIDHPNGYTSVYGHLSRFAPEIERYVRDVQYQRQSERVTIYPPKDKFPVEQGDVVAFSGNTGHSFGPHLHFEIRHTESEHPLNTLLFGYPIKDKVKPRVFHIVLYPQDNYSRVAGINQKKKFSVRGGSGNYEIYPDRPVRVQGRIGFGIRTHDYMTYSPNRCGVYSVKLFVDEELIYSHTMNEFGFDETRYLNSFIDYEMRYNDRIWSQKSYVQPNNKLSIYENVKNRGIVNFTDNKIHKIKYILTDANGNQSTVRFRVKSSPEKAPKGNLHNTECSRIMPFGKKNTFREKGVEIEIPQGALYDTLFFEYKQKPALRGTYSPVHALHNELTPLHKAMSLKIACPTLPQKYRDKALVASVENGRIESAHGGSWHNGHLQTKTRYLGEYTVAVDTVPPRIVPLNIRQNQRIGAGQRIEFAISDNLSGIKSYKGYINGQWALFEYNPMRRKLTYTPDPDRLSGNKHRLRLEVTDGKGNKAEYSVLFFR